MTRIPVCFALAALGACASLIPMDRTDLWSAPQEEDRFKRLLVAQSESEVGGLRMGERARWERLNEIAGRMARQPAEEGRTESEAAGSGAAMSVISLLSPEGQAFVGPQLRFFDRSEAGVLSVTRPSWIYLYWTEGRDFMVSGEVRLGGEYKEMEFPEDLPDGFALFVREWDGMHRYQLDSRRVIAKRRLLNGSRLPEIEEAACLGEPVRDRWVPFQAHVSQSSIHFRFGESSVVVEGPLDSDGANKIAIAPGTKLRNLRLAFGTDAEPSASKPQASRPAAAIRKKEVGNRSAVSIVNGGFEQHAEDGAGERGLFGEPMFSPGSELLPGWSVSGGFVGLRDNPASPAGGQVLELGPRQPPGTVTQEIRTEPGRIYELSFYTCGGRPGANRALRVTAGDLDERVDCPGGSEYKRVQLTFRAGSPVTTISITGIGHSGFGPMIDDVRVEEKGGE